MDWAIRLVCVVIYLTYCASNAPGTDSVYIGYMFHNNTENVEHLRQAFEEKIRHMNREYSGSNLYFDSTKRWSIQDMDDTYSVRTKACEIIHEAVVAFIVIGTPSSNELFGALGAKMNIPIFMPLEMTYSAALKNKYVITMTPSIVQAIVDIMHHFRWENHVYYIYDSDDGLLRLQAFYNATSVKEEHNNLKIHALRIHNISYTYDVLRIADYVDSNCSCKFNCDCDRKIILDLSTKAAYNHTLDQIINVGMNRDGYHYILCTLGIDDLDLSAFEFGGVNIIGFSIVNKKYTQNQRNELDIGHITYQKAMVVDTLAFIAEGIKTLKKDRSRGLTNLYATPKLNCDNSYITPWMNGFNFRQLLNGTRTRLDNGYTGTVLLDVHGARKGHSLDVHQLGYRKPLQKIGTWSPNSLQDKRLQTDLPSPLNNRSRDSFTNKTWIITTIEGDPFFIKVTKKDVDPSKPGYVIVNGSIYEGYSVDVAEKLKARYEKKWGAGTFNYKFRLVADKEFGQYNNDDGTWDGMIGELLTGKADMALSSLTINAERQRVVDFTKPFMKVGISIMIKTPDKQKPGVFSFMKPLSINVWLCVVIAFLGVSVVLFFVGRWSPYEWQQTTSSKEQSNAFSFSNTLWFALGALMQQGSDIFPRSLSGRVVGSAWWFFTLILISSYTANLAAFLTIEKLLTPIKSVDDLAKQTEIEYGIRANGATEAFFRSAKIDVYQKLWTFMNANRRRVMVPTDEDGIERVRNGKGKYAYLLESPKNEYINQRKPCNTMMVGDLLDHKGYGVATPQKSKIRKKLNLVVLELREEGELHKLEQRWWYDKGECGAVDSSDTTKNPLTLSNVSGIFHILISGLVLSMIVSLLEHMIHRLHRKRKERLRKWRVNNQKPAVKIERKNPLEVLKAAGYTEHENNAYLFSPPDQLTTFESGNFTELGKIK